MSMMIIMIMNIQHGFAAFTVPIRVSAIITGITRTITGTPMILITGE